MRSSTGRWVSGDDFFDRESELQVLKTRVRDGNHVLLTGQRRMGKTSIVRELGRELEADGWIFLFTDVEGATCPEDAIADIARAVHPVRTISERFATTIRRLLAESVEEVSAADFSVKIRDGLDPGSWRRFGGQLLAACTAQDKPVLLVIDELPIFLKRMLHDDAGARRVDEFLSWLRGELQIIGDGSLVLIVSGSIGLVPIVKRLGIPDRINHLYPFRLGPWDRNTSIKCFERLAASYELRVEDGVAGAVYERLGVGIPHHVQSFFACIRDYATMKERERVTVEDVAEVYRTELLGPSGQNDLAHYETRLKDGLDEPSYSIAKDILAEASIRQVFATPAKQHLVKKYSTVVDDAPGQIADVLEVLVHDGYLEADNDGHRFPSHLLRDWWTARFGDHHASHGGRRSDDK